MAVSGLVIYLQSDECDVKSAIEAMSSRPELTIGERAGCCLPAVLEMADDRAGREMHSWLEALSGVHHVDVVYVHFGDDASSELTREHFETA